MSPAGGVPGPEDCCGQLGGRPEDPAGQGGGGAAAGCAGGEDGAGDGGAGDGAGRHGPAGLHPWAVQGPGAAAHPLGPRHTRGGRRGGEEGAAGDDTLPPGETDLHLYTN